MKRISVLAFAMLPLVAALAQTAPPANVDNGISVDLALRPLGGGKGPVRAASDAEVLVRVRDQSGAPIAGSSINAWFAIHAPDAPPLTQRECVARVATFTAGGLFRQPALDLNVYRVVVLNADPTLSVVDPKLGFGGTHLLAMVQLESPAEDWTLDREQNRIYVAMPAAGKVAVVDTTTWKVAANIDVGPRAGRVVMQADGGYLWATYDDGVAAIDPREAKVVKRIKTGVGPHDLAISDDNRSLFVTNAGAGTTSVIDVRNLKVARQIESGKNPVSVDWSPLAHAAYVASSDGTVTAIDAHRAAPRARVASTAGLTRLRFAPGGRLAFITNPSKGTVIVLDAASNRIVQTAAVDDEPFEVTFSDTIAYIRRLGSETVLMITLANVGTEGTPVSVADFPGGQRAFGENGVTPIPAPGIVQTSGENAVLVTNPADGEIYYYREGMAAPAGDLSAYSHTPRAAMIVDRSLREVKPGMFATVATMPKAGRYDVALYIDSPRVVTCFPVEVGERVSTADK